MSTLSCPACTNVVRTPKALYLHLVGYHSMPRAAAWACVVAVGKGHARRERGAA